MIDWLVRRILPHCKHAWMTHNGRESCAYCGIGRWRP